MKTISKYIFHYNLLFIVIQIHTHINPTTFTSIYIKLWHHSIINVLKLKGSSLYLTNDFSDINFFNKKDLFIYLFTIYSKIMYDVSSHTHTHTQARVRAHKHMHMHTQILQHEKHGLAFIFCKSILFPNFWIMSF